MGCLEAVLKPEWYSSWQGHFLELVTLSNLRKMSVFTTRDGHAPLAPPAQGTDARGGERWLGGGKALPGPGGTATLLGGADVAGLRGS